MRKIDQIHHDGLGLNDRLTIEADERDPDAGGASHEYVVTFEVDAEVNPAQVVAHVQFQHGPRFAPGSTYGATEAVLCAILIDRLRAFQSGPFACRENALALAKIEEAHHWLAARAKERARRGVLGKSEK